MNRYICRDFYEEECRKAFQTWKKDLQNFHQTLKVKRYIDIMGTPNRYWYIVDLSQNQPHGISFHQRSPQYYIDAIHQQTGTLIDPIQTHVFSLMNITGQPLDNLPSPYYYSNGSLPRLNGTFGFT